MHYIESHKPKAAENIFRRMKGRQTKPRAARAFNIFLNDREGHTLKVNKDRPLLLMLNLHYMLYKNSVVIRAGFYYYYFIILNIAHRNNMFNSSVALNQMDSFIIEFIKS